MPACQSEEHAADLADWWTYRPATYGMLADDERGWLRTLISSGDREMAIGRPDVAGRIFDKAIEAPWDGA